MTRYLRAFFTALQLTLRGQRLAPRPPSPLAVWMEGSIRRLDALLAAADRAGVDAAARQTLKVRIDGRPMSVETLLATVRYHAAQEYPMLLGSGRDDRALNAIYASNLNDHFWLTKLSELAEFQQPALKSILTQLIGHLQNAPRPDGQDE